MAAEHRVDVGPEAEREARDGEHARTAPPLPDRETERTERAGRTERIDRSELALVVLVLIASAGVLLAPVVGRAGAPVLANALMILAAGSGVAGFGLAAAATIRSARRHGRAAERERRERKEER